MVTAKQIFVLVYWEGGENTRFSIIWPEGKYLGYNEPLNELKLDDPGVQTINHKLFNVLTLRLNINITEMSEDTQ